MAYTKQTWADLPSKTTPINAERLTHIEDGIFNAAQTADTAASTAGTAAANVGIVSGKVETLTERVNGLDTAVSNKVDKVAGKDLSTNDYTNTDKAKVDALGTASTKNSTSVVTESSDLVESGAVYDALAEKADNSVIGTVEDGTKPTKSYAVREHMIRGGKFCTVTVPVTTSSTWVEGSNYTSGDVADSLIKEATFGGTTSNIGALIVSTSNTRHLLSAEVEGYTATLYKRSEGYGALLKTPQGEPIVETAVSGKYYYIEY